MLPADSSSNDTSSAMLTRPLLTRRSLVAGLLAAVAGLMLSGCAARGGQATDGFASEDDAGRGADGSGGVGVTDERGMGSDSGGTRIAGGTVLVAYFSHTGTTRGVAETIAERMGADIFEIVPVVPYPDGMAGAASVAETEHDQNARPAFVGSVDDMASYDVVFLGYPIWYGTVPMVVATFAEAYDFTGKTVVPFCTSAGGTIDESVDYVRDLLPGVEVLDGLAANDEDELNTWLESLGF